MKNKLFYLLGTLLLIAMALTGCLKKDADDHLFEHYISYAEFGAVGDGKTDDFAAIKKTHQYANANGMAVKADSGATYYIGAVEDSIEIKQNVDWTDAQFIIDDQSAASDSRVWWYPLFRVLPDTDPVEIPIPTGYTLTAGQQNIGMTFEHPALIGVYNQNKKDFIRHGFPDDHGSTRQEIILVDTDGNVHSTTPIQWDYTEVTKMVAYSIEEAPILLRGGKFTTIANDDQTVLHYFERGIKIERSNTTLKNVEHYVVSEGATGSPYNGFFRTSFANHVIFENCIMTGHKLYKNATGGDQGTYDTRLASSNDVQYLNCTQSNDHTDPTYWGIMCSDYCKNLTMSGCKLSRFDAHMGVYNATITNCDIGQNISVVGGGLLYIENVIRRCVAPAKYFNRFVTLREDYGSFFYGDIVIKNSTLITSRGINYVIAASWYDWDFGYPCQFPTTITLDNVKLEYENVIDTYVHPHLFIFSHLTEREGETPAYAAQSHNPPFLTKKVIIQNNQTTFKVTANTMGWFADTQLIYR